MRGELQGALDFVLECVLPALLSFPAVEGLPSLVAHRQGVAKDLELVRRVWKECQRHCMPLEDQHQFALSTDCFQGPTDQSAELRSTGIPNRKQRTVTRNA